MQRKQQLLTYINTLHTQYQHAVEVAPELLDEALLSFASQYKETAMAIELAELLVPVVGGFSAGKSTALNSLMHDELLPVDVTAETAIPAELRYSSDEHIIAVGIDGTEQRHPISALSELSANAAQYEVVRLYLERAVLKQLEPITLVDMPGFDSPLDQHNQAILRYLNRGAFYLYLVNTSDGTLRTSDIRRLDEVNNMGRPFRLFLTKKDLLPASPQQCVQQEVQEQIEDAFGLEMNVGSISQDDTAPLLDALLEADSNELFNRQYVDTVKALYYRASADINTALSMLKSSSQEGQQQLDAMQIALTELTRERDRNLASLQSNVVCESHILSRVEQSLQSSVTELAACASTSNDALARAILDIVRGSLVSELQQVSSQMSSKVVHSLSKSINLSVNTNFNISEDWMQSLISGVQNEVMDALLGTTKTLTDKRHPTTGNPMLNLFSSIAVNIPNPYLRVVFAILPGIVGSLFDSAKASYEQARIVDVINTQVIPSVIDKIRPELALTLSQITEGMIRAVAEQFETKLSEQRAILSKAQEASQQTVAEIAAKVDALQVIRKDVNTVSEQTIF